MGMLEVVAGVMLILSCLAIIFVVLAQEPKGQGLSSVITGTEMMSGETRARSKEASQAKFTRYAAIAFFILTIVVNAVSVFASAQ